MGSNKLDEVIKKIENNYYNEDNLINVLKILMELDINSVNKYQSELKLTNAIKKLVENDERTIKTIINNIKEFTQDFAISFLSNIDVKTENDILNLILYIIYLKAEGSIIEDNYDEIEDISIQLSDLAMFIFAELKTNNNTDTEKLYEIISKDSVDDLKSLIEENKIDLNYKDYFDESLLHLAIKYNAYYLIDYLLTTKIDINTLNYYLQTPLHIALADENYNVATYLLEKGALFNIPDEDGNTAIHLLCLKNKAEILNSLEKLNINSHNKENLTPIEITIMGDFVETFEVLLNKGDKIFNNELLFNAIKYNALNIFYLLMDLGYDLNIIDKDKHNLLHYVAISGNTDIAINLIDNGVNINARTKDNYTPLDYAILNQNYDIINLFIENYAFVYCKRPYVSPLQYAAQINDFRIVKSIVEAKANINYRTKKTISALSIAVENNNMDIVKFLLINSADINLKNSSNITALHFAVKENNVKMVKLLIANGADVNINRYGFTPLLIAVINQYHEIVEELLNAGAIVNNKIIGKTYLHHAIENKDEITAAYLVDANAYINIKDFRGHTPLYYAKINSSEELVNYMIRNGKVK